MQTRFRTTVAVAIGAGQLLLLGSCESGSPPTIAVVAGQHANAIVPERVPELEAVLSKTRKVDQTKLVVVRADGRPSTVLDAERPDGDDNPFAKDLLAEELTKILADGEAATPEVDLLAAIDQAARELRESKGDKTLFVIDSGLQTTGALRFQTGLLLAEPKDLVASLQQANSLPDLSDVSVVLIGIGSVASPQPSLPIPARRRLEAIWKAIITASKAKAVTVVEDPPQARARTTPLPRVTVVPVAAPPPLVPCRLQADSLGFEPDSKELRDARAAVALLRTCVARLATARRISVIGTTSSAGTEEGRLKLSQERAEVIRNLLIGFGISPSRLTAKGIGNHCKPPCVDDRPAGVFDPILATRNRLVIVQAS